MNLPSLVCKARGLGICDLPADVLILMLSLLHGQDIARCKMVCRHFSTLIRSELSLQYKIELTQNGMIDGQSSTLRMSERLQRLREYASRFRNGIFDHEDLTAHEEYADSFLNDPSWTFLEVTSHQNSLSTLYVRGPHDSPLRKPRRLVLSAFTPGSAQAGIQASRCLLPIDGPHPEAGPRARWISKWAIDGAQDLLVMAEGESNIDMPEQLEQWLDEFRISFCSFGASKTTGPTPHPDAMLSAVRIFAGQAVMQNDVLSRVTIFDLHIAGEYVIWVLVATRGKLQNVTVEVCDWRRGEVISRIDVGTEPVKVIPLSYPYFLVIPKPPEMYSHTEGYRNAADIYSFAPFESAIPSPRLVCTLQLPGEKLEPGEYIGLKAIHTGDRPQPSTGHFLPDLSRSMVVLTFSIHGGPRGERETHYLIPRATLLAQIHAAESQTQQTHNSGPVSVPVPVPWADWGPQGCLRLALQPPVSGHCAMPFGSRFPLFVLDESDARNAAVYVFDLDPLVVRFQRQIAAARRRDSSSSTSTSLQEPAGETTASGTATNTAGTVVEDVEAVLPGVVDRECSSIPYVVHRLQLPCADKEWRFVEAVAMGMTGFTIKVLRFDLQKEQTWSV